MEATSKDMKESEAKEGLRVYDYYGIGTLHKNVGYEEVSEWYIQWDKNGETNAVLSFDHLYISKNQRELSNK
jgi:hypothetical protein